LVCYIRKYLIILGDIPVDVPQPKYWDVSPASPAGLTPVVPANHVVLVRLTLGQFILWPKSPPNAGFGIKNLKKNSGGNTPGPSQREGATPSCTHSQHGYMPCAGAQAPPLLGPRSWKPFPKSKFTTTPLAVSFGHCDCMVDVR